MFREKNLKVIMYQTTDDYSELRKSSAIVLSNSTIQLFSDLKGKKACFTRYNGLGEFPDSNRYRPKQVYMLR